MIFIQPSEQIIPSKWLLLQRKPVEFELENKTSITVFLVNDAPRQTTAIDLASSYAATILSLPVNLTTGAVRAVSSALTRERVDYKNLFSPDASSIPELAYFKDVVFKNEKLSTSVHSLVDSINSTVPTLASLHASIDKIHHDAFSTYTETDKEEKMHTFLQGFEVYLFTATYTAVFLDILSAKDQAIEDLVFGHRISILNSIDFSQTQLGVTSSESLSQLLRDAGRGTLLYFILILVNIRSFPS